MSYLNDASIRKRTKSCFMRKRRGINREYGLNLQSARDGRGAFVDVVGRKYPADLAGLRPGDRIIEINGQHVENEPIDYIRDLIRRSGNGREVRIVVLDGKVPRHVRKVSGGRPTAKETFIAATPMPDSHHHMREPNGMREYHDMRTNEVIHSTGRDEVIHMRKDAGIGESHGVRTNGFVSSMGRNEVVHDIRQDEVSDFQVSASRQIEEVKTNTREVYDSGLEELEQNRVSAVNEYNSESDAAYSTVNKFKSDVQGAYDSGLNEVEQTRNDVNSAAETFEERHIIAGSSRYGAEDHFRHSGGSAHEQYNAVMSQMTHSQNSPRGDSEGDDVTRDLEALAIAHDSPEERENMFRHSQTKRTVFRRLCHVTKGPELGYGFNVKATDGDSGTEVGRVWEGTSASAAGIKSGDKIIEINGINVENEGKDFVVAQIQQSEEVRLLVEDSGTATTEIHENLTQRYSENSQTLQSDNAEATFYSLTADPNGEGYGFDLKSAPDDKGTCINQVWTGSPAEAAGLKGGELILAVNGHSVQGYGVNYVVQHIKASGNELKLLALAENSLENGYGPTSQVPEHFVTNQMPSENSVSSSSHAGAKLYSLTRDPDEGYGFDLRPSARGSGICIGQVFGGSPAEEAGIQPGLMILAVNNHNVEGYDLGYVIQQVKAGGNELQLLLLDANSLYNGNAPQQEEPSEHTSFPGAQRSQLTRDHNEGFGFTVKSVQGDSYPYFGQIFPGSPAEIAGYTPGDKILAINGISVEGQSVDEVVNLIRASGDTLNIMAIP